MMLEEIDTQYAQDIRSLTYFRNLIWKDKYSLDEALTLNEFRGFVNRDVSPNRITYDEMISTGKLYYLSNKTLVNEIINYYKLIENHIYQSRQSRVEFRASFYE